MWFCGAQSSGYLQGEPENCDHHRYVRGSPWFHSGSPSHRLLQLMETLKTTQPNLTEVQKENKGDDEEGYSDQQGRSSLTSP